jgi:hypothetical protein
MSEIPSIFFKMTQLPLSSIKMSGLPLLTHHVLEAITWPILIAKVQPEAQIEALNNLFHLV